MNQKDADLDLYIPSKRARRRTIFTPRVLLVESDGKVPLLAHRGWYGLFGGHVTLSEAERIDIQNLNLLNIHGAFPTLQREVKEESGHDIGSYLQTGATCMGLAEVTIIDKSKRTITDMISPIYLCRVPRLTYAQNVTVTSLQNLPSTLFPDAELALSHLRNGLNTHRKGTIFPEWLNHGRGVIVFMKEPTGGYILNNDS